MRLPPKLTVPPSTSNDPLAVIVPDWISNVAWRIVTVCAEIEPLLVMKIPPSSLEETLSRMIESLATIPPPLSVSVEPASVVSEPTETLAR